MNSRLDSTIAEARVSRRGFLLGSLAASLTVTAAGSTALMLSASPVQAARRFPVDVTKSYKFTDSKTGCQVQVSVSNGVRRIRSNGLPNHSTGAFPNTNNPNTISAQSYDYSFPLSPKTNATASNYSIPQPFGIAVNGVLFDPLAAEWFNNDPSSGWSEDPLSPNAQLGLDSNHAHVQPTGAYHYHGIPDGLANILDTKRHSPLIGWAGDGFPIYLDKGYKSAKRKKSGVRTLRSSFKLKSGTRPSGPGGTYDGTYIEDYKYVAGSGDLDESNGRFQVTPEFPKGAYCYILTEEFPVIPLAFRGNIASSFAKSGPGGGAGRPPGPGEPQRPPRN